MITGRAAQVGPPTTDLGMEPPFGHGCEGCNCRLRACRKFESRQSAEGAGKNRLEATPPPRPYTCGGCDGLSGCGLEGAPDTSDYRGAVARQGGGRGTA